MAPQKSHRKTVSPPWLGLVPGGLKTQLRPTFNMHLLLSTKGDACDSPDSSSVDSPSMGGP